MSSNQIETNRFGKLLEVKFDLTLLENRLSTVLEGFDDRIGSIINKVDTLSHNFEGKTTQLEGQNSELAEQIKHCQGLLKKSGLFKRLKDHPMDKILLETGKKKSKLEEA